MAFVGEGCEIGYSYSVYCQKIVCRGFRSGTPKSQGHRSYVKAEYRSRTSLHNERDFSIFEKGTWGLKRPIGIGIMGQSTRFGSRYERWLEKRGPDVCVLQMLGEVPFSSAIR